MPVFGADCSEFQGVPVDGSYPWPVCIWRHSDGTYSDPLAGQSLAAVIGLVNAGRVHVAAAYHVFRPGNDQAAIAAGLTAFVGRVPNGRGCVMIDVESWGGQIKGDHTPEIESLRQPLVGLLGGNVRRVWAYANGGNMAEIYPGRPAGVPVVAAGYGPWEPQWAGADLLGWQYKDAAVTWGVPAGYPAGGPPWGATDMNVFPGAASGPDLAAQLGLTVQQPLVEGDMRMIQSSGRGIALVGAGYFRQLSDAEDVAAGVAVWGQPVVGNDRQFDLWAAQASQGTVAGLEAAVTAMVGRVDAWGTRAQQQTTDLAAHVAAPAGVDLAVLTKAAQDGTTQALAALTLKAV